MASGPYHDASATYGRDAEAPRERSVGEHIFIWVAWAAAAVFWGAMLSSIVGILQAAAQVTPTVRAPGMPGGMPYLALVILAFLFVALALLYAEFRTAQTSRRIDAASEAGAAALYSRVERQGGEE
jgi:H+/Cl- antiporter ClcA